MLVKLKPGTVGRNRQSGEAGRPAAGKQIKTEATRGVPMTTGSQSRSQVWEY